uniref:Uncharacterized protein n=1 Tax=Arundo donax TaxID=35708 RepID=A0A0A9A644_ARUDO
MFISNLIYLISIPAEGNIAKIASQLPSKQRITQ